MKIDIEENLMLWYTNTTPDNNVINNIHPETDLETVHTSVEDPISVNTKISSLSQTLLTHELLKKKLNKY